MLKLKLTKALSIFMIVVMVLTILTIPASASERVDGSSPLPGTAPAQNQAPATTSPSPAPSTTTSKNHYHYFGSQLDTPQEKQLYSVMENELLSSRNSVTSAIRFDPPLFITSTKDPKDESKIQLEAVTKLQRALDAFKFDHPQFYWITGNATLSNVTIRVYTTGELYIHSASAHFELYNSSTGDAEKINATVNRILTEAKKETTDLGRIRVVHDMLAKQITYGGENSSRGYQITGGLADGVGTCEAYSKSFKLIMDYLGYENVIVAGKGNNKGKQIPHMWNYVKLNGNWYAVDVTWDDQKVLIYDYFLAGGNTVAPNFGSRTFNSDHTPEFTFSYLDYKNFYFPQLSGSAYR